MEEKKIAIYGGIFLIIILFVLVLIPASKNDNLEKALGSDFMGFNQPSPAPSITELKVEDTVVGAGADQVVSGDVIEIHYVGTLSNGQKIDSSYDRNQPITVELGKGAIMPGIEQGVIGMRVGGKRKIFIPSNLAYGEKGNGPVGPNMPLIFEIELMSHKKASEISVPPPLIRLASPSPVPSPEDSETPSESLTPNP